MTMTQSESGRLGARALNSDPEKKRAAAKKAAASRLAKNPNVFKEMGTKGGGKGVKAILKNNPNHYRDAGKNGGSKKRANKNV